MAAKTNEIATKETADVAVVETMQTDIRSLIYVVRGQQVMFDSDLAMLYQVETKVLNQAVKRNISRFPDRFRFQLTKEEFDNLKSQIVTSSLYVDGSSYGGRRKLPFAFTEQGISMLSAVLRSEIAIQVSIRIIVLWILLLKCESILRIIHCFCQK